MSWDAAISYGGHQIADWNYTHNTSRMIYAVLKASRVELADRETWWDRLKGMSGTDGAEYLSMILGGLAEAPELFRSMNPENGWGDYDSLMKTLCAMRDVSRDCPLGVWWCGG